MHLFSNLHYGEGATTSFTEKCSSQGYSGYAKAFESLHPCSVWEPLHFLQSGTRFGQGLINWSLNSFHLNQKLKTQALVQIGQ